MKKLFLLLTVLISLNNYCQKENRLFGKDPIINLENFQKQRVHFGFFLGFNSYDFQIDYQTISEDIEVVTSTGFNVGLITNLRVHEHVDLRFEPGLYYTKRDFRYPTNYFSFTPTSSDLLREVNSTYLHFPLLLKFSSLRTGNVRPYLVGGLSATLNLASNAKSKEDNFQSRFRVNSWTKNYELGFGIDIFSEFFIFSPSIRGVFGMGNELIADNDPNSPWTSNIKSIKSRGLFINFSFH